jgi:hypothetical protein
MDAPVAPSEEKTLHQRASGKELDPRDKFTDINDVINILKDADTDVFCLITSNHGLLSNPVDGVYPTLPPNVKLLVIAARDSVQRGYGGQNEYFSIKYLKAIKEGVQNQEDLFDEDGCLTSTGEKTLSNLVIIMGTGKTYKEYYGVKYGEKIPEGKIPWYAFKKTYDPSVDPDITSKYAAPFLTLKEYDNEYNEQVFSFSTYEEVERFGIIFMYNYKHTPLTINIFLSLKSLLYESKDIYFPHQKGYSLPTADDLSAETLDDLFKNSRVVIKLKMSEIFNSIQELFDDERTNKLKFNFTHQSCRVDHTAPDKLTRELSNRGENKTINCFIKKFDADKREELTEFFKNFKKDPISQEGFSTIFEFYNHLKKQGLYDNWLQVLRENGEGSDALFQMITQMLPPLPPWPSDEEQEPVTAPGGSSARTTRAGPARRAILEIIYDEDESTPAPAPAPAPAPTPSTALEPSPALESEDESSGGGKRKRATKKRKRKSRKRKSKKRKKNKSKRKTKRR